MDHDSLIRVWRLDKVQKAVREYALAIELLERDFEDERLKAQTDPTPIGGF